MEILYILTVIVLGISFMLWKKKDEKINFIKWLIIFAGVLFGYNVFIGMVLGLLNITSHIWLLSLINIVVSVLISFKAIKNKDFQKYFVRKLDIAAILVILAIFTVMLVKDLYIHKGDVVHGAVDSAVHYRAAKHYSENLKIFINVEDKTFFNFNVMQTGAYINDGIFMNIVHGITKLNYAHIYQIFETIVLFLIGLALYAEFADKIKTKRGLIGSLVAFGLYIYGYPYNSWIYGFSYFSVGIMFIGMIIPVMEALYDGFNKKTIVPLVILLATGLIFSYCLFVPAIFAAICIYCFLKDLSNKEEKKILKFFGPTTLLITTILLVITMAGIGYLFIPTFFIEGQTNLVDALKIDGAIYSDTYKNFIPYIPFAIMYLVEIIKKIKNKQLKYMDIFAVIMMLYFAIFSFGLRLGKVSLYYMFKIYYVVWMVTFVVVIDLINKFIDEKNIRVDVIVLVALFPLFVFKRISSETIFRTYAIILLTFYIVLPEIIKNIDFSKLKFIPQKFKNIKLDKICITGCTYVCLWALFVSGWVWIKAGHVIGEEEKHSLPDFVGIYYFENCFWRKSYDLNQNFNKNSIELATYARENLKDMKVENTCLMTQDYYPRIWAVAVTEISSPDCEYGNVTQDGHIYTVEDALKNEDNKYMIKLVSNDATRLEEYKKLREEVGQMENIKILLENENGFVAEIIKK